MSLWLPPLMLQFLHNFLNVVALKTVTFMLVGDELNI